MDPNFRGESDQLEKDQRQERRNGEVTLLCHSYVKAILEKQDE